MKNVLSHSPKGKRKKLLHMHPDDVQSGIWKDSDGQMIDSEHLLISMLLPPAVKEFLAQLEKEVETLCGKRYERGHEHSRWGDQKGSIYLGGQKIAIEKPRIRNKTGGEKQLNIYEKFQSMDAFDRQVFIEGLKKVSQRDYEKGLPKIASSFGFKKSKVSKSWVKSTKKKLEEIMERGLADLDIVSIFIDGKRFRDNGTIVALGVSTSGRKYVLGLYESSTENSTACLELLNDLERRGLPQKGILFVVDGGSGINKALEMKYAVHIKEKRQAVRLRCHFHKMNNIEDAIKKDHENMPKIKSLFWAMRSAKDHIEAKAYATSLEGILKSTNQSAMRSFLEAKDDLLMLHNLDLSMDLKRFFSTTNPIENLNSVMDVRSWPNSDSQFLT